MGNHGLPPGKDPEYLSSANLQSALTISVIPASLRMHYVPESDLESLALGGVVSSLSLVFFGLCFGGLATCWSTAYSGSVIDAKRLGVYWTLTIMFLIMTVFFGAIAAINIKKQVNKLKRYRNKSAM